MAVLLEDARVVEVVWHEHIDLRVVLLAVAHRMRITALGDEIARRLPGSQTTKPAGASCSRLLHQPLLMPCGVLVLNTPMVQLSVLENGDMIVNGVITQLSDWDSDLHRIEASFPLVARPFARYSSIFNS
jgi:hypothetical protein